MVFPRSLNDIKGITIHETSNYEMSASELFEYLNTENKTSQGTHFLIDHNEVVEVMPLDWSVYHTGKGKDWGNKYTIAIELCSSVSDIKFNEGLDRMIALIKDLMEAFNLTTDDIYFHRDFNDKVKCPNILIDKYKSAKRFAIEELL